MRVAREYIVSGLVQGVGFRYFTQASAMRAGVRGWVENLPDGRVAIAANGEAGALEQFERDIRSGPSGARVDDVETREARPDGRHAGFSIR